MILIFPSVFPQIFLQMEENAAACAVTLSKEDFDEICRCCLSPAPLSSIFELIYEDIPLVNIFSSLFGVQLDPNDYLPKKICETCIGEVVRCHNFKKCYETSEVTLLSVIMKEEVVEVKLEDEQGKAQVNTTIITNSEESVNSDAEQELNVKPQKSKTFTCLCGETFPSTLEFRQHRELTNHKLPRTHSCKICGKFFAKKSLWSHSRTHDDIKRYSCDTCGARFNESANLSRHKKTHTNEKPFLCEFCGKAFIQGVTLEDHRRVHTGEKPYLCNLCGKPLKTKLSYRIHMHSHNKQKSSTLNHPTGKNKKTFLCDKCGRNCSSQATYKLHLHKHGLEAGPIFEGDRHQCQVCFRFYATKHTLSLHMLSHNEKQFMCSECGKGFHVKTMLESHILTHTGEKPFACSWCPKKFRRSTHLTSHLRVHTGERPYVCKFCGKSFPYQYSHTVHVRTHTGEKPYKCDLCEDMFYDSGYLKKHKKLKHS